jgi:CHAT domain-containing protein
VAMPTTPDAGDLRFDDLPAVPDELERIAGRITDRTVLRSPTRDELERRTSLPEGITPTAERVVTALASHAWVHFACHGGQDVTDPSRGAVYLADGPLTVLRIAAENFANADLAFLSACETAVGGIHLLDEAIHLAAALMLAGYCQVIATQWSISDIDAPLVADSVYGQLIVRGSPEAADAARAVHQAIAALRAREPGRPDLWAPYLHVGV